MINTTFRTFLRRLLEAAAGGARVNVLLRGTPVRVDCLHLQLYRDSKDRYKQGQTKASLSLQHFLGLQSGFTLDKESNTIAIICQDLTVVLAFDTRERLIQWQVKIANNLGEGESWLVQVQGAPARGKVAAGPARLHVRERQFCMTVGVPPRLVGCWQIAQLRKYGVVEGRFCFEGGSQCGRGEGLYVLVSDQAVDLARAFQLAAEGRLHSRSRLHCASGSPSKRVDPSVSVSDLSNGAEEHAGVGWPSCEIRPDCDYADTASVNECPDNNYQDGSGSGMERCMSCISKLGAMSRSSTMAHTPGTPTWPAASTNTWDSPAVTASYANDVLSQHNCTANSWSAASTNEPESHCCPSNTVKPFSFDTTSISLQKQKLDMTLSTCSPCHLVSPYENYDFPKTLCCNHHLRDSGGSADKLYDTPKQLREGSAAELAGEYGNYDTPQPLTSCPYYKPPSKSGATWRRTQCPCRGVVGWMSLPHRPRENKAPSIERVRLSGEGKMPITSQVMPLPIYATIDRSKKTKARLTSVSDILPNAISNQQPNIKTHLFEKTLSPSKLSNVGRGSGIVTAGIVKNTSENGSDYVNFQFAQSLEYYENSKDFLKKPNISLNEVLAKKNQLQQQSVPTNGIKVCMKCGHSCDQGSFGYNDKHGDYLIMEPPCKNINTEEKKYQHHKSAMNYPGYLPMQPVSAVGSGFINPETIECISFMKNKLLLGRATSSPSLSASFLEKSSKQTDTSQRTPYTVLELDFPESCTPLLHRKQFNRPCVDIELKSKESSILRKRSNSADSARYIDDLESIAETPVFTSSSLSNTQGCSGTNSVVSLPNHSLTIKRLTDAESNSTNSNLNINSCGNSFVLDNNVKEVPYNELSKMEINIGPRFSARDTVRLKGQASHIRRSSSVPCKSGYNRDSSSSNDSGVSIGSLKQRGSDFVEFELPLTTSMSTRHHDTLNQHRRITQPDCLNTYLPKRSKSSDLLRDVTFEFEDMKIITHKSSSAEAEVPICLIKKISKGYVGPNNVPFIDSRSTSSGTSDMSDYIETLSLSSFSSSDTPDSLRLSRSAATTLRPRSGKEYHKIDRCMLDEDMRYVSKNEHPETKS